jgi:hypothetical protein
LQKSCFQTAVPKTQPFQARVGLEAPYEGAVVEDFDVANPVEISSASKSMTKMNSVTDHRFEDAANLPRPLSPKTFQAVSDSVTPNNVDKNIENMNMNLTHFN